MVLLEHKLLEGVIERAEGQPWWPGWRSRPGHSQATGQQALVDGVEETLHASATTGLADLGKDEPDFEVGTDLFEMLRREITAVIGVQDPWNPADLPSRLTLAPDGLTEGKAVWRALGALKATM